MMQILLADDDIDDCMMFSDALEDLKLNVRLQLVHDGEHLMKTLITNTEKPDIVFLDLNMPRKNGNTCLEEIKTNIDLKNIPVVIISTSCDDSVADVLYKKGAHFYICKPTDYKVLRHNVDYTVSQIRQSLIRPSREQFILTKPSGA
jgi:PleD family two-component response regulator